MEELIIRFGNSEGARNPTDQDIRTALEQIKSGVCRRPEFTIENVNNWKTEVIAGLRRIRCILEGRYISAATFYLEGSMLAIGWVVVFYDELKKSFVLCEDASHESAVIEEICC